MTIADLKVILVSVLLPTLVAIGVLWAVASLIARLAHRKSAGHALLFAFCALGVTTGFAAGHSRESILGAVLPALLTVLSSLLAYLLSKDSLAQYRPVIPYCISVLVLGSLLGLSLGSTLRKTFDDSDRKYKWDLLRYEHVTLETEKAQYLAKLEVWKQEQILALKSAQARESNPGAESPPPLLEGR